MTRSDSYDEYVDYQTGRIKLNRVCKILATALWGLVFAKARASFNMSDIIDRS